jgi:hypothetical protein
MAVLLLAAASHAALAATTQIPPWYTLTATLEAPPQIKVPVVAKVTVGAPLVDLQDLEIVLVPPAGWAGTATPSQRLDRLAAGETRTLSFTLTPTGPVAHGSIVVFLRTPVPKGAIQEALRATMGEDGPAMAERVAAWPAHGEGITEIAFSLLPEESFYPLTGDMWTTYDDRLKKEPALRGPGLFREAVVTPFQAQTDVDMHDRLTGLLQTDPTLAGTLEAQGIDLARKRQDLLLGLYVLATEAYLKGETATARRSSPGSRTSSPRPRPPWGRRCRFRRATCAGCCSGPWATAKPPRKPCGPPSTGTARPRSSGNCCAISAC